MNREILFRGKRVDNGEWVYGDLAKYMDGSPMIMESSYFATRDFLNEDEDGNPIIENEIALGGFVSVIPLTVGQFTGLTDKNRTKIFEGDKTKDGETVVFEEGIFGTTHEDNNQGISRLSEKRCKYIEIINP